MPTRRLTESQRREIVRERGRGVPAQDLAARFGVSRQTIHATLRQGQGRPAEVGTQVVAVRVSERELRQFEVALSRHGLTRSAALKRMMRTAGDLLAPDEAGAQALKELGAAINRLGGNVNQIARACNEARLLGHPLPYTAQSHAEVREALRVVFEVADQIQALARSRRSQLDVRVVDAFREEDPHAAP
ncbi:HTH domain-containing protein [Rubellimicrobium roseum]|uniref:HTH domain-containing protein n=1 Tax=Rubellimicrobium roseum TaxID=687525 RepID=A0A5C4NAU8_9RHOB|nr:HTH domain-containing protein [Rubellimicrobium roseum]TNC66267.1 HTH domain-containing protein [Rubellimicrobium roseum]